MTLKEIVKSQIEHQETEIVPYTLDMEPKAEALLTKHFGNEEWKQKLHPAIDVLWGTYDTWDTFKSYDLKDPSKKIDAYGSKWTLSDSISHLDEPILEKIPLHKYQWPVLSDFLTLEKAEKMRLDALKNPERYKVGLIGAGYWELTWRLMGLENALIKFMEDPEELEEIWDHLDVLLYSFIDECAKLPIDAIYFGDDWCDQRNCIIGPDRWRQLLKPRFEKLYARIHNAGFKTITHCCGSVEPLIPDLIEIGLDVLESVQPEATNMNPYELKKRFGKNITFWGGLGCQSTITFGTPEDNRNEIRKLRSQMSVGGGYILAPTKPLNSAVSLDNLLAIYETFIEGNARC